MKIAIDGPSASGKSTIAKELSFALKIPYLETGLVYRTFGYLLKIRSIPLDKWELLFEEPLQVIPEVGGTVVIVENRTINEEELKTEEVGRFASQLGAIPEFRERINAFFRSIINEKQIIVEGRDAGTHIIPEAPLKFFITASPEERARRRYEQLKALGKEVSYEEILKQILERDKRDMERPKYPFRPAEDAIIIDTTDKTPQEVLEYILNVVKKFPEFSQRS
ncbi:(d)CMP kinase [Aquifex sp.]